MWLLFNTVKYLQPIQVYYRLYYWFRKKLLSFIGINPNTINSLSEKVRSSGRFSVTADELTELVLQKSPVVSGRYLNESGGFTFLNISHNFTEENSCLESSNTQEKIDFNFAEHGKLW